MVVQFIVDRVGNTSDVKAISGPSVLRAEREWLIRESSTWISATQNGQKVTCYKKKPIIYKLSG
ncbi:MAG: hypothetical protein ABI813_09505 [Bacteroidota bacterium]